MLEKPCIHHPEELVYVVSGIADHPSKYDENVIHIQHPHDFDRLVFGGRHRFADLKSKL